MNELIKALQILSKYVEGCREIIIKPPNPFELPLYCDAESVEDMEYSVILNTKADF